MPSDVPTHPKHQRTSRIATRSSTRTPAPSTNEGALDPTSPSPTITRILPATPSTNAGTPAPALGTYTPAVATPIGSPDLQPTGMLEGAMDVDVLPSGDAPLAEAGNAAVATAGATCNAGIEGTATADTEDTATTTTKDAATTTTKDAATTTTKDAATTDIEDAAATTNIKDAAATNTKAAITTDIEDIVTTEIEDSSATDIKETKVTSTSIAKHIKIPPAASSTFHTLSSVSLSDIDKATIPTFLLCHGKGKREVNIFDYLKKVEDPHFQRILFYYLCFENGCYVRILKESGHCQERRVGSTSG